MIRRRRFLRRISRASLAFRASFVGFILAVAGVAFVEAFAAAATHHPAVQGPTAYTKSISVDNAAAVPLVFSTTSQQLFGVCTNQTTGVNLFVVSPSAANTTNGEGPYCDTCTDGPQFVVGGADSARTSAGTADVRCRFYDAPIGASAKGVGFSRALADTLYCKLAGCTMTGTLQTATGSPGGATAISYPGSTSTGWTWISLTRLGLYSAGFEKYDFDLTNGLTNIVGIYATSEIAAPSGVGGQAVIYADSTSHRARLSNNNDAFADIARSTGAAQSGAYTNATNTMSTVTGVSVTLGVGQWYCESSARFTQSTAGEGATFQLTSTAGTISGGGTSTFGDGEQYDGATLADSKDSATQTITTTDASVSAGHVVLHSAVNVATTMTYVLQGAEASAHVSGTVTVAGGAIQCIHL